MNEKFEIKTIDNEEVLEKITPIPQYGEGICKIETVITKEAFLLCYNAWVKKNE